MFSLSLSLSLFVNTCVGVMPCAVICDDVVVFDLSRVHFCLVRKATRSSWRNQKADSYFLVSIKKRKFMEACIVGKKRNSRVRLRKATKKNNSMHLRARK